MFLLVVEHLTSASPMLGISQELFDWRWLHMHKPSEGVEIENVTANFGTHAWHVMQQKLFRIRNKSPPSESFEGLVSLGLEK